MQIYFTGDVSRLEAPLPEVPCPFVALIEVDGIIGIYASHKKGEVLPCGFDEQVIMVVHQAVRVQDSIVAFQAFAEYFQKHLFVSTIIKDIRSIHALVDDMMVSCQINTRSSCHCFAFLVFDGSIVAGDSLVIGNHLTHTFKKKFAIINPSNKIGI